METVSNTRFKNTVLRSCGLAFIGTATGLISSVSAFAHPGHEVQANGTSGAELMHQLGHILFNPAVFLMVCAAIAIVRIGRGRMRLSKNRPATRRHR